MTKQVGCIVAMGLLMAGCGGGGGGPSPVAPPPVEPPPVEPVPTVLFSDLLFSESGTTNEERVENIACPADLSSCTATFQGINLTFATDLNAEGEGTGMVHELGAWAHMYPIVVDVAAEGLEGRMAAVAGHTFANSLPVALGSATWEGTMVALDHENQPVRGGATLTIDDLATPAVDVELTPQGHDRHDLGRPARHRQPVLSPRFRIRLPQGRVLWSGGAGSRRRLRAEPVSRDIRRRAVTRSEGGSTGWPLQSPTRRRLAWLRPTTCFPPLPALLVLSVLRLRSATLRTNGGIIRAS